MSRTEDTLLQYGIPSDLADALAEEGLTATKIKILSQNDLVDKFKLTAEQAKFVANRVKRAPIDRDTLDLLLRRSNHVCCICKGAKGKSVIVHHIKEYSVSQDNTYSNLIVLCPNDHDLAHRKGGLTLSLSQDTLHAEKYEWEHQVEKANAAKAAQDIEIDADGIDFVNIKRIEDLCISLFGKIPQTPISRTLMRAKILSTAYRFDKKYVRENLSGGSYLFDFTNSSEAVHYRALLIHISDRITLHNLKTAIDGGYDELKKIEGKYAFFLGGVYAKQPDLPITDNTPPITMHYTRSRIRVEWILDPNYLLSMSAIGRLGRKTRYLIYCLVRSVEKGANGEPTLVDASALLIGRPSQDYDRTPAIAYIKQHERDVEDADEYSD